MTNIIKNNIHLSHQCLTSRFLVGVILALVMLIGVRGNAWGDTSIDVPEGLYDVVVSNVTELRAALATGGSSSDRKTIFIQNGTYDLGTAYDTEVKDYTTLVGQSRDGVIIKNSPEHEGIWTSATLRVKSNVIIQNLTIQCEATIG